MTNDRRRWQLDIAIRLMEEVIDDLPIEAHDAGRTPASPGTSGG